MAQCGIVLVVTLLVINFRFARNEIASVSKINNSDWWKNSVIYQIYPRSFKDSNGDGVGDINGITSKLDYLVSTGINAVWLSPIFKSPMVDFGYDISNFKEIDPIFGTMKDFENLRNKTMEKGIKLILDFVPNHSSDQHEWFQKSVMNETKYKDYFIWGNGRLIEETYEELPPNNWLSVFGGSAWTWNEDRGQYYYHQFTKGQPDLNYRNPEVVKDMEDVITFWLEKGIDGFRVDAVSHLFESQNISNHETRSNDPYARPGNWSALTHNLTYNQPENHGLIARWRSILDKYSEKDGSTRIMFTESYGSPKDVLAYYGNNTVPEAHFPFNFDLILKINNDSKAQEFKNVIEEQPTKFSRNWVIGNHDQSRVASRLGRDMVDIMNMLVLLLPGTAITYSGEEIGMEDTFVSWNETKDPPGLLAGRKKYAIYSRDPERTPFQWDATNYAGFSTNKPWLPVNENYKELNLENQMCASSSHYKTYKQLLEARKHPAIRSGDLKVQIPAHDVLSFTREKTGSESFLIIMNLGISLAHVDFSLYKTMKGNFTIFATSMNSTLQEGSVVSKEVMLQPKEAVVLITPARSPLSSFKTASSAYQHSVATFQLILPLVACQFIFFSR